MYCSTKTNCFTTFIVIFLTAEISQAVIPYPPSIVRQPPSTYLPFQVAVEQDEKEKPFFLECEAKGEPEPTYSWTKNGKQFQWQMYDDRISQQLGRGTLVVTSPSDVDEGYYQCYATNEHGTAVSNGVFVRKSELNALPDELPAIRVVNEGKPLTLECKPPTGFPKPTISWVIQSSTDALRSVNSSRMTVDPEGHLHFSNVTRDDSYDDAMYACAASLVYRNEYKLGNKVELKVELSAGGSSVYLRHPPVQQYVSPPNIVALKGDKLEIHCIFGGTPLPEIRWKKKEQEQFSGRIKYTNYGKTLVIKRVDFEDEGSYECSASNGMGTAQSRAFKVIVRAAPYWLSVSNDTNVAKDEDVKLECKASGVPNPKVKWFMNGKPLSEAKPNPRRSFVSSTVMRIKQLEKSDTAVYQCNASNSFGYVFKNFYVNALALALEFVTQPEKLYEMVDGSTIVLSCNVFGSPKPTVKWTRNGQELTGNRYQTLENGDLQITKALFTDAGHYQCIARNKLGEVKSNDDRGFLEVKEQTRLIVRPENYEVSAGQSATFRCEAAADPSLTFTIKWFNDGQLIDFDQEPRMFKASDGSLAISKTQELDSGEYACVAKTRLDNVAASAMLIVQAPPNPPSILKVHCNSFIATVVWEPNEENRAPILSYAVQFNTSFTPHTWEVASYQIPASDTKLQVSMSSWANYSFRVTARNKIGESRPSRQSKICQTPADVPSKNPDNVVGKGTTPSNLVISWTPMPLVEHNAPGFFYRVYFRLDHPEAAWGTAVDITDWKQSRYEISNVKTFQAYFIKVEAHNSMGQANVSAVPVRGFSGEDVPLQAPKKLALLRVIDKTTVLIGWESVPKETVRGHFRGYKVLTWTTRPYHIKERTVPPTVTEVMVYNLLPFTENNMQVRVFNDGYDGPFSDIVAVVTPEGVPGPVQSFGAVAMGANALWLTWNKPLNENGVLTGYQLRWQIVKGTQIGNTKEKDISNPNETKHKLTNLQPGTKYRVTVVALTLAGGGTPYFIECTTGSLTPPRAPDKPNFNWTLLSNLNATTGVQIIWLPNLNGNPGSHFYVKYRLKGESIWTQTAHETNLDSIMIEGLDYQSTYEFAVVAVDGVYMESSDIQDINTSSNELVPMYVWNWTKSENDERVVEITRHGINRYAIVNIFVMYSKVGDPRWSFNYFDAKQHNVIRINGLDPYSQYEMIVVAVDKDHKIFNEHKIVDF